MKKYKVEAIKTNLLKDIICDICGNSCKKDKSNIYELATFSADWGYFSNKDGEQWSCDLCEECADRFAVWVSTQFGKIQKENKISN